MEKNQPNTRNLLKAELSMPVSYWNKHYVHEIEFILSTTTEDEIRQYQASKFELNPLWEQMLLLFLPHIGCDSYLENNAQLKVVIEELAQSSVMFNTMQGAWS